VNKIIMLIGIVFSFAVLSLAMVFGLDVMVNSDNYSQEEVEIEGEIVGIDTSNIIVKDSEANLIQVSYEHKENLVETENGIMANKYDHNGWLFDKSSGYSLEEKHGEIFLDVILGGMIVLIAAAFSFMLFDSVKHEFMKAAGIK